VGLTLGYNAVMTGSALTFPYEAFAPRDGLGFGHRRILGHEVTYTPELALRANALVLRTLATGWFTAGLLGTVAAGAGAVAVVLGIRRDGLDAGAPLSDRQLQVVLLGVGASVVAGNVYFWGNYNVLGDVDRAGDGLVASLGPYYHFDLLMPTAAFAAVALVAAADAVRGRLRDRVDPRAARGRTDRGAGKRNRQPDHRNAERPGAPTGRTGHPLSPAVDRVVYSGTEDVDRPGTRGV
jgi:hypothetical protein